MLSVRLNCDAGDWPRPGFEQSEIVALDLQGSVPYPAHLLAGE
jgi:hypothetical protein